MGVAKGKGVGKPMPSANEILMGLDPTREAYGITEREVKGMSRLLESGVNPFNALPVAPGSEYFDAIAIFEDDEDYEGYLPDELAGDYYSPEKYDNLADENLDNYDAPAPLSVIPTSTMNYRRPRTVAAGYAPNRDAKGLGVLTVVFRDGTFYNYHDVSPTLWNSFKSAYSKGRFILRYLDSHPRGVANMGGLPSYARETLYRIARTNQIFYEYEAKANKSGGKLGNQKQSQGLIPVNKANKQPKSALKSSKGNQKKKR